MASPADNQRGAFLGVAGLLALLVAGFVLATSWLVPYPAMVFFAAWVVAIAAMATVTGYAFRESRATGVGFFATVGRSFKELGRFIFWFF